MDLKEILGEELYKQVSEKLGDKKIIINDGSYLPKSKFDEKNEEVKLLKEKVTSLEKTGKDTEELLKNNAELKTQYEKLQQESKTALEARDKEITNITKKTLLSKKLSEKGAKYPDLLMKEFDIEKIELDGEDIKGFDDLVKPFSEKYGELFAQKEIKGTDAQKGAGKGTTDPANMDFSFIDNIKF